VEWYYSDLCKTFLKSPAEDICCCVVVVSCCGVVENCCCDKEDVCCCVMVVFCSCGVVAACCSVVVASCFSEVVAVCFCMGVDIDVENVKSKKDMLDTKLVVDLEASKFVEEIGVNAVVVMAIDVSTAKIDDAASALVGVGASVEGVDEEASIINENDESIEVILICFYKYESTFHKTIHILFI
jgi:hypothetical protein